MGRITIFNTIGAVILAAIGAAVTAPFGSECVRWGVFGGSVLGFFFPRYPIGFVLWIVDRIGRCRVKR
jgi:hypothetical protein